MNDFDEAQLSAVLRLRLAPVHAALEVASGLPDRIATRADYVACLQSYYPLFAWFEREIAAFADEPEADSDHLPVPRATLLQNDLHHLGAFRYRPLPPARPLTSYAQALGVRYVLEGSALGGAVILSALQPRLGPEIAGATSFFAGLGRDSLSHWRRFKAHLDRYGATHPQARDSVLDGATLCFGMFLEAAMQMAPAAAL